jgi:hypothetical protein
MMEEKKEFCIRDMVEAAKDILKLNGRHAPQFIGIDKDDNLVMAMLLFGDDSEKGLAINFIRNLVKARSIRKYWIITEAWTAEVKDGEKLFRCARRDINRKEALIINGFSADMTGSSVSVPFRREGQEIIFEEEKILTGNISIWNAYLEKEGLEEGLAKAVKGVNDAFIKRISHEVAEKYKAEFFACKTAEGRMKVLKKIAADGLKLMDDQKKTMLEMPDDDADEGH